MDYCAIISEYNPLHTGHAYQIGLAKQRYAAVICIMSGDFVQRARPAVADKAVRAAAAIDAGADLVVELPPPFNTADAERFAYGGVRIASILPGVTALMAGSETADIQLLTDIAQIQAFESDEFKATLQSGLNAGTPYAAAYAKATEAAAPVNKRTDIRRILKQPNALLCIEYIKAILRQNSHLSPHIILRAGAGHDRPLPENGFASASAVREMLYSGNTQQASGFLHNSTQFFTQTEGHLANQNAYDILALHALRTRPIERLEALYSAAEGVAARLQRAALRHPHLADALQAAKTKRYTAARLNRLVYESVTDITKSLHAACADRFPPVRVLAVRKRFRPYLAELKAPFVIQNKDYEPYLNDPVTAPMVRLQQKVSRLHGQLTKLPMDPFYARKLIVID